MSSLLVIPTVVFNAPCTALEELHVVSIPEHLQGICTLIYFTSALVRMGDNQHCVYQYKLFLLL